MGTYSGPIRTSFFGSHSCHLRQGGWGRITLPQKQLLSIVLFVLWQDLPTGYLFVIFCGFMVRILSLRRHSEKTSNEISHLRCIFSRPLLLTLALQRLHFSVLSLFLSCGSCLIDVSKKCSKTAKNSEV